MLKHGRIMTCFVEHAIRREVFHEAGIERVRIEENPLPFNHSEPAGEIFVIERTEPALINGVEGHEYITALPFCMIRRFT